MTMTKPEASEAGLPARLIPQDNSGGCPVSLQTTSTHIVTVDSLRER